MTIQSLDPPDQVALRQALLLALQRADRDSACQGACDELERGLVLQPADRPFDFMAEAAAPAAMRFACGLVGMPDRPAEAYRSIFLRLTWAMDSALDDTRGDRGVDATRELATLVEDAAASASSGTVIRELYALREVPAMPAAYVRNTIAAAFNAAFSTAYSSMGSFLLLAQERPGLARSVVDTGNVAVGVDELLRFTSPAQSTRRYATADTLIGGVAIQENDPILTLMAAANRDPDVFERPDELMLDRSPNPHLAFASGPHYCVGAAPANEFLGRFVERLAGWEDQLAPAGDPTWLDTATLRCLDQLPVARRGPTIW